MLYTAFNGSGWVSERSPRAWERTHQTKSYLTAQKQNHTIMKKTLFIGVLALMVSNVQALSLDDALYAGISNEVAEDVSLTTDGAVSFNSSTAIFTVDTTALVNAYKEGEYIELAYLSDEGGYVFGFGGMCEDDSIEIRGLGNKTPGDNTVYTYATPITLTVSQISSSDYLTLTLRGLAEDGGGPAYGRYAYDVQLAGNNSRFTGYRHWTSFSGDPKREELEAMGYEWDNLWLNTDIVGSYHVFDQALTANSKDLKALESAAGTAYVASAPAIPEPTTATLSLLALAGIAARRRRTSR